MNNDVKNLFLELRPYIIKRIHDIKIEEYRKLYKENNGGNDPDSKDINNFISKLVAHGIVTKEADGYIDEWIKKYEKKVRSGSFIKIALNTAFLMSICVLSLSYIILYSSEIFSLKIDKAYLLNWPYFINALILLFYFVVSYIIHTIKS